MEGSSFLVESPSSYTPNWESADYFFVSHSKGLANASGLPEELAVRQAGYKNYGYCT